MVDVGRSAWVTAQIEILNLHPGDQHYAGALQAAEAGWPAHKIAKLWKYDLETADQRRVR